MFEASFEGMTDEQLRERHLAVTADKAALEAYEARLLAVMWERQAHLTPEFDRGSLASWIRSHSRCSKRHASRLVKRGRTAAAFPVLASTLDGGEATAEHLDAVGTKLEVIPEEAREELEDTLIDAAVKVTVEDLSSLMSHLQHRIDPDGATEAVMRREVQAGVSLDPVGSDGMVAVSGLLSAVDGAALLAATEPFMKPAGENDTRTPRQRRAEALGEVARRVLAGDKLPDSGGRRPQVMVVVPLSTLTGQTGAPAAKLVGTGAVLDGKTAQAVCCDAAITRIVHDDTTTGNSLNDRWKHQLAGLLPPPLAGPSVILDLGRTRRSATADQRKALIVRDGGCVHPGCDRPPSWAEVHHLDEWWAQHGSTDLNRMCRLCTHHHHQLHRHNQRLERRDDGTWYLIGLLDEPESAAPKAQSDDSAVETIRRRFEAARASAAERDAMLPARELPAPVRAFASVVDGNEPGGGAVPGGRLRLQPGPFAELPA